VPLPPALAARHPPGKYVNPRGAPEDWRPTFLAAAAVKIIDYGFLFSDSLKGMRGANAQS
jgi:hypothetical protein